VTNSLHNNAVAYAVSEVFMSSLYLGNSDHLDELGRYLDEQTDLGRRWHNYMPDEQGANAIKIRYLGPLVTHYLLALSSLEHPSPTLASLFHVSGKPPR